LLASRPVIRERERDTDALRLAQPENLLLAADGTLKITDFGLSTFYIEGDSEVLMVNACGTHHYAAPEVTRGAAYDGKAADVWSCGVILYVFLSGGSSTCLNVVRALSRSLVTHSALDDSHAELPFESDVPEELHRKIQAGIVNVRRTTTLSLSLSVSLDRVRVSDSIRTLHSIRATFPRMQSICFVDC